MGPLPQVRLRLITMSQQRMPHRAMWVEQDGNSHRLIKMVRSGMANQAEVLQETKVVSRRKLRIMRRSTRRRRPTSHVEPEIRGNRLRQSVTSTT